MICQHRLRPSDLEYHLDEASGKQRWTLGQRKVCTECGESLICLPNEDKYWSGEVQSPSHFVTFKMIKEWP